MIKVSYLIKNFLLYNYPGINKLGFIKRINKDFHDNYTIKLLYFTVIRYFILRNNSLNQTLCLSKITNQFYDFCIFNVIYKETFILVMILLMLF